MRNTVAILLRRVETFFALQDLQNTIVDTTESPCEILQ